jgi:hypothetical protein
MSLFAQFEVEVIEVLAGATLSSDQMTALMQGGSKFKCEFTGYGYFVTVTDALFPMERVVRHRPTVTGTVAEFFVSFVMFLGEHEVVFECYPLNDIALPEHFRDLPVRISQSNYRIERTRVP